MIPPESLEATAGRVAPGEFSTTLRFPGSLVETLRPTLEAARDFLLGLQHPEGYWVAELEADTTLESDYILLEHYLGDARPEKVRKAANYVLSKQLPDGGWNIYAGGPSNISATVKAYFALKLAGFRGDERFMRRAREAALSLGGVQAANTFTKIYFALFGQYDWDAVPAIPPELILLPELHYFSIYQMSSWSRAILVPLSVIYAHKPLRRVPGVDLDGVFLEGRHVNLGLPRDPARFTWRNLFLTVDRVLKVMERSRFKPLRQQALRRADQWMRERFQGCEGLGAIFPAMMNAIIALDCLGYKRRDPVMDEALRAFYRFEIEEGDTLRLQPCLSPVWDTAIALYAAIEAGLPADSPAAVRATDWLLDVQTTRQGEWKTKRPNTEPGGWYFEFKNEDYPDTDDTAMVLLALSKARASNARRLERAIERGLKWTLSMQGSDGGFAAFDVDNNHAIYCHAPFADHNAMLDPSCPDLTGRVLEAMAQYGYRKGTPQADRAIRFLQQQQEPEGCWFGRWGVNYIYGTCFALRGLRAAGEDPREAHVIRAGEWLRSIQNPDGGWGETCESYDNPDLKGQGPSTASQTAWALLGLFAAGDFNSEPVRRGIEYLLNTQTAQGTWEEPYFTGTGFPRVFYLRYHLYRHYFPLLALAEYARGGGQESPIPRFGRE